jgi:hypothetical protein
VRNLRAAAALERLVQPVSPTRWRFLPTLLLVIVAIVLGAVTARADTGAHHAAAPSASSRAPSAPR